MELFTSEINGEPVLRAMPLLLLVLCVLAIAYRYYSAFLAARVAMLDDSRVTPAHRQYLSRPSRRSKATRIGAPNLRAPTGGSRD